MLMFTPSVIRMCVCRVYDPDYFQDLSHLQGKSRMGVARTHLHGKARVNIQTLPGNYEGGAGVSKSFFVFHTYLVLYSSLTLFLCMCGCFFSVHCATHPYVLI